MKFNNELKKKIELKHVEKNDRRSFGKEYSN